VSVWSGSLRGTVNVVLTPLISSGVLAGAAVWAAAACVLPWLLRGRSLALDAILVVIWSATLVSACTAAIAAVHGAPEAATAPDAVLGAVLAALVALGRVWLPRPGGVWGRLVLPLRTGHPGPTPDSGVGPQFP
jgi:hypothetical protein